MHITLSGPILPLTQVEAAFAKSILDHGEKHQSNPATRNNGTGHSGEREHKAILKSAQRLRDQLIKQVEHYTGKPIAQFAEEVRNWRKSNYTTPFPSTAYNPLT